MPDVFRARVLAFFRVAVSFLFLCHGIASLFGVMGGAVPHGGRLATGTWPGWYAAVIQLVTGGFVALGLWTLPAALLASGSMAYAYFTVHQQHALFPLVNHGEPAAMFALAFLVIAVIGPGAYALDSMLVARWRGARLMTPWDGAARETV